MDQSHVIPRQRGHWPILRLKNSYHTLCNMVPHFFCKYCTVNQSRYGHYNSAPLPQIRCATNITQKNIERKLLVETNVQTLLPNNSNLRDCCRLTGRQCKEFYKNGVIILGIEQGRSGFESPKYYFACSLQMQQCFTAIFVASPAAVSGCLYK